MGGIEVSKAKAAPSDQPFSGIQCIESWENALSPEVRNLILSLGLDTSLMCDLEQVPATLWVCFLICTMRTTQEGSLWVLLC